LSYHSSQTLSNGKQKELRGEDFGRIAFQQLESGINKFYSDFMIYSDFNNFCCKDFSDFIQFFLNFLKQIFLFHPAVPVDGQVGGVHWMRHDGRRFPVFTNSNKNNNKMGGASRGSHPPRQSRMTVGK
jgi:hypothetical protein